VSDPAFVLVASPFTGPFAWSLVADELRARGTRVAVDGVDHIDLAPPVVLAGHSGAGPHLPRLAARLGTVCGMVLVDALLPHPGRSWAQTVPDAFATRLRAQAVDGRLPPWPQWWGEDRMRALLPDDALRDTFVRSCPAVSVEVIDEILPELPEPPAVFVQLSDAYAPETAAAREHGWPVLVIDAHHLALLTKPREIADTLGRAAALLQPGAERRPGRC
jgi:hypothetical protein